MTSKQDQIAALDRATHYAHKNSGDHRPVDGWERGRLIYQVNTDQIEVYDASDIGGRYTVFVRNKPPAMEYILPSADHLLAALKCGEAEVRDALTLSWTQEAAPDPADFDGSDWWEVIEPHRVHRAIRSLREVAADAARLADRLTDDLLTQQGIIPDEP